MIISKKTNPEELDKISNGDNIQITKDVALNQDFLLAIATRFPDSKISIFSGYDSRETHSEQNPFFDNEQLKTLNENAKILLEQHKIKLVFDDDISIEQATLANRKFNNWVSDIQKASIDGKELSDLEKFLWAYQIVTERVYTLETSEETTAKSRNLFEVLTGDKIVCVGYANMLVALCTKLGVKCTFQTVSTIDPNTNVFGNHATVAVRIDDEKYGIHGIFYSDPTIDSATKQQNGYGHTSFKHALIPFAKLKDVYADPILIDKKVHTGLSNFITPVFTTEEAEHVGENVPKILAHLFPEMTGGKTQSEILEKMVRNTVLNSTIKDDILSFIDSFDDKHIEESLNSTLNTYAQFSLVGNQPINQWFIRLIKLGYSKEDSFNIIKDFCSKEKAKPFLEQRFNFYKDDFKTKQVEKAFVELERTLKSFEKNIDKFIPPTNTTAADALFENLALKIATSCTAKHFFDNNKQIAFVEYAQLLKMGFTKKQISEKLKELCVEENLLVSTYLTEHPNNLKRKYETNENEIFMTSIVDKSLPSYIFNEPYEEAFKTECSKASSLSLETIYKALINVFKSQNNSPEIAEQLAALSLRRTISEQQMQ